MQFFLSTVPRVPFTNSTALSTKNVKEEFAAKEHYFYW